MRLIFLGTSAGSPTRTRNVTGLAVCPEQFSDWILIDCGEGTQHQIQKTSLSLNKLTRVFITHLHGDHVFGLPGLINSRMTERGEIPLEVYGPKGLKKFIVTILKLSDSYVSDNIIFTEIPSRGQDLYFADKTISAIPLSHNVQCFAYLIKEKDLPGVLNSKKAKGLGVPSGPLMGKLKKGESVKLPDGKVIHASDVLGPNIKGLKIIVCGDNDKPSILLPHLKDANLWVHEATYTQAVLDSIPVQLRHSSAKQVAEVAQKANLQNLILTHFSTRYRDSYKDHESSIGEIHFEARESFRNNLFLASDLDEFHLDKDGTLSLEKKENYNLRFRVF